MDFKSNANKPLHVGCIEGSEKKFFSINVGSRKSELALKQTNIVIEKLENFYLNNPDRLEILSCQKFGQSNGDPLFNVVAMTTTGDQVIDKPLPSIGTKSLFTRELEIALLDGRVDFVVHSLKDLPTTLPDGCTIGAVLKRDNPDDTIVLKSSLRAQVQPLDLMLGRANDIVGKKIKIGTSSQRRIAMIKRCNPNLECIDIRGNLNTRILKLDADEGDYAAIILARAGLDRMGWSDRASCQLRPECDEALADWCYAVGQGAIAVECRSGDSFILKLLASISDIKTTYEVIAERSLMKKLEGGCSVPLGVRSTWTGEHGDEIMKLESLVLSLDGKTIIKADCNLRLINNDEDYSETVDSAEIDLSPSRTTGIDTSQVISPKVRHNMIACSSLGIDVANKMIDKGCLKLMALAR